MVEVAYGDPAPPMRDGWCSDFLRTRWWELSAKQASGLR
jgi:hypothetical protein